MGIVNDIKQAALGNNTNIESSDETKLRGIFNRMFFLEKDIEKETAFVKQVMTRGAETQERSGLHASAFIKGNSEWCLRQQVLSLFYKQLQGEQVPVNLKRIFEEGNAVHEKWQRMFLRAGYSQVDELDKTQYNDKYSISYTPDIICRIPEFYDGEMVGELKSVNTYQFQKMSKHPSAGKQLQWYMYLTGIHKGFVLSEDKNNQDFKIEIYDYDPDKISVCLERAEMVKKAARNLIDSHRLVKRPTDAQNPDCKRCVQCPLRLTCWKLEGGGERING